MRLSRRFGTVLILALVCPRGVISAEPTTLASRLEPLIKAHEGQVAIVVQKFGEPAAFSINPDEPMPTASLIKFPVMIEAYYQFHEGKAQPGDLCQLQKDDKVPGSGILTDHFSPGATFALRDAVRMMTVWSDNTATNLVLDHIGIRPVNARMESLGLKETKIHSKVYKRSTTSIDLARSEKYGLGSTTAHEMIKLLTLLHEGKLVSSEACKEMTGHMLKCDDANKLPRFLPAGTKVAMKTGSVNASRTVAGIIYCKQGPVAVCVLTDRNKDQRWVADNAGDLLCAKIAREVYDQFK